jgi:hypothetical protein
VRLGPAPARRGADLGFDLIGFWKWSVLDLVSNATSGRHAEYIISLRMLTLSALRKLNDTVSADDRIPRRRS